MTVRSLFRSSMAAFAFLCLSTIATAQPGDGGTDPDPGTDAPVDLGIITLVAIGAGYAAKRRYDARKKEKLNADAGE